MRGTAEEEEEEEELMKLLFSMNYYIHIGIDKS